MMNRVACSLVLAAWAMGSVGCATEHARMADGISMPPAQAASDAVPVDRMLIWRASMTVEVGEVSNAVASATALAAKHGGFVEDRSDRDDGSTTLTFRVPAKTLDVWLSGCGALGRVTSRTVSSQDVTEQYVDVAARLANRVALRDRLRELLVKATAIKDVLAIETELNRVQADVDSMEGRIKSLRAQVDMASVVVSFERRPILGPLGFVFKGLWWGIEKLFVIRR